MIDCVIFFSLLCVDDRPFPVIAEYLLGLNLTPTFNRYTLGFARSRKGRNLFHGNSGINCEHRKLLPTVSGKRRHEMSLGRVWRKWSSIDAQEDGRRGNST